MKDKRIRNLIIMIAVLALLMITYFVSGALTGGGGETTPQETAPSYPVADVSPDGVERITMTVKYLDQGEKQWRRNAKIHNGSLNIPEKQLLPSNVPK